MGMDIIARAAASSARTDAAAALARTAASNRFTELATQSIDAGITTIHTSGYSATGLGAARYASDGLANAALAAAHPRFCKGTANGRYFRLVGDCITVDQAGATGSGNDQPAIQAALNYAAAVGIREVRLLKAHESWQPAFPGGTPDPWNGCHAVITGNVALVGAPGGTTISLKGPGGATRTKTDGTAAWFSGWLFYAGNAVTESTLRGITVLGGLTFSNVLSNAEANVYDKGICMLCEPGGAPNLVTVDHRDVVLSNFAGEIWYMGGAVPTGRAYVENLTLTGSPQCCWNPGTLANVFAVNVVAGDSYQPCEVITNGHTYIGGRFYNGYSCSFIMTEALGGGYYWSYPLLTSAYPKWTQFEGTRFEKIAEVGVSSRTRGRIVTVDTPVGFRNYGKLTDISLTIEAWCDQTNNGSAVYFSGPANATVPVPNCPAGTYYESPRNIAVEVIAKRTNDAAADGRKWYRAVQLSGGLVDRNSCTFTIRGDLTALGGTPAEIVGAPSGSQFPKVDWDYDNGFSFDAAYPNADFSAATGITHMGINVIADGTFTMTLTNANNYAFAQGQKMRVTHTGGGAYGNRKVVMPASGNGYSLKETRVLYGAWDYVDLIWDYWVGAWVEQGYRTRQRLTLTGSKTYDAPNIAAGSQTTTTVTVTGAAMGDRVRAVGLGINAAGLVVSGYISAANTATVVLTNLTGAAVDLVSTTLTVEVVKA